MMGKLQMDREWTEQDLRAFAEGAQAAFETVLLDELHRTPAGRTRAYR